MDARKRPRTVLRRGYHRVFGPLPADPTRGWRAPRRPASRRCASPTTATARSGPWTCSHGVHNPVGWPPCSPPALEAAYAMELSTSIHDDFDHLPGRQTSVPAALRAARRRLRPARRAVHAPRDPARHARLLRLREDIGRRLGRHVFTGYRVLSPFVRVRGHRASRYPGPEARAPPRAVRDAVARGGGGVDHAAAAGAPAARAPRDRGARRRGRPRACQAAGRRAPRPRPVLGGPGLRCANGYNLSAAGAELAGEHLAEWVTRRTVSASTPQAAGTAS